MIKRLFIAVAMLCAVTEAQVPVTPIVQPHVTFVDGAGLPCAGCTFASFVAGTTTPLATYTDAAGSSVNTNPIVLGADGGPVPSGGGSGAIWLSNSSYKLILKSALGATIWSVDQVKGGGGLGGICGPVGAVQIANSSVNGLTCDANITINTTGHTLNVGTLPANHVVIGALGSPTLWTFDTTSPATALASLGGGIINAGTTNQIAIYPAAGQNLSGSSSIPAGITAITASPGDNSTKPATTAYVVLPGAINPTSVQVGTGAALSDNQGNAAKVQHSTGATTTNNCVKFDANGNTVDAGFTCVTATPRTCNANGCYRIESDGTIEEWGISSAVPTGADAATVTVTFPFAFTTTTNLSYVAWADSCATTPCNTANKNPLSLSGDGSGVSTTSVVNFVAGVVPTGGGGVVLGSVIRVHWHAVGN